MDGPTAESEKTLHRSKTGAKPPFVLDPPFAAKGAVSLESQPNASGASNVPQKPPSPPSSEDSPPLETLSSLASRILADHNQGLQESDVLWPSNILSLTEPYIIDMIRTGGMDIIGLDSVYKTNTAKHSVWIFTVYDGLGRGFPIAVGIANDGTSDGLTAIIKTLLAHVRTSIPDWKPKVMIDKDAVEMSSITADGLWRSAHLVRLH
eukprot:TRINITY_DN4900_c0_g1_i4.p1 TRINITY_DN4900_c0_g1~~TRINITY_DN4900_c0_g1_i4.p1  ORF type:complete len:207 (-),score=52.79 TRINITY_DN4900_c0_g1_i4:1470-2090(-)